MKIITVVGARPQFIKAAAVSRAVAAQNAAKGPAVTERIVHTGQHWDRNLSEVFFEQMGIPRPDHELNVREAHHGTMTGRMLAGLEDILLEERPDVVLIYGDTNSTLAGALAAAKLSIPVAHVEAGLRSGNFSMPEEINRVVADRVSSWLFCPTKRSVENLAAEGIRHHGHGTPDPARPRVVRCGDVMADCLYHYQERAKKEASVFAPGSPLADLAGRPFCLATVHRAGNADDPEKLSAIVGAFSDIAKNLPVLWPVHPRTAKNLEAAGIRTTAPGLRMMEPVGYLDMLALLSASACSLVITDSGGLQKEAYLSGKPCVTLREETEWVELLDAGANVLAGADRGRIVDEAGIMMQRRITPDPALYGDGLAAGRIVAELAGY
ncbi:MAG: UDP-N-acetylglucosamine 2-epimerase (non-hydrolyzing) [Proteobacteria bacterium]|nr:UDP-N-acetylglucosamine 2-epimerase (non-hydrolyzing) [Pseudomonadota bacterium]